MIITPRSFTEREESQILIYRDHNVVEHDMMVDYTTVAEDMKEPFAIG